MRTHRILNIGTMLAGLLLVLATIMTAASCGGQQESTNGKLGVAVTIAPIADFIRNIGGDKVDVTIMVPPGASPHLYEPTPNQMVSLSKAEVYVKVGSRIEFELGWMDKLIAQNPGMSVVNCSAGINLIASTDPGEPGMDPHVWTSPVNAETMVRTICDGLIAADPANAEYYKANRDSYLSQLNDLATYIHGKLDGYQTRYFLVYHPSFGYLASEYNLIQIAIEHEGKEPTAQGLQQCIDLAKQYHLNYVYTEPQFALQYAQAIADSIGGQILVINPLPDQYIPNMRNVADSIALEME